jgi:hypothetical protein
MKFGLLYYAGIQKEQVELAAGAASSRETK